MEDPTGEKTQWAGKGGEALTTSVDFLGLNPALPLTYGRILCELFPFLHASVSPSVEQG